MCLPTLGLLGTTHQDVLPSSKSQVHSSLQSLLPTHVLFEPQPYEADRILTGNSATFWVLTQCSSYLYHALASWQDRGKPPGREKVLSTALKKRKDFLSVSICILPPCLFPSLFPLQPGEKEALLQSQTGLIQCPSLLVLISPSLCFLICKMGTVIASTS